MTPRRRALRDHGDARPLLALVRAQLTEAAHASERAREGLEHHFQTDSECRIIARDADTSDPERR